MFDYGLPILTTVALWWASTGLILRLDSLDRRTFGLTLLAASAAAALALWLVARGSGETTVAAAYTMVACGLVVWGWQLLSFYTGFVTGPRKSACPPDCRGLSRFVEGLRATIYHEMCAVFGAAALFALTFNGPNRVALWTYLILWLMHQSAKLNVFLGVPNLGEDMLPDHLRYLESFMARRPMNVLFPVSVTLSTVITAWLFSRAAGDALAPFEIASGAMLATLMALGLAEHWFLVAPIDGNALWTPFLPGRPGDEPVAARPSEDQTAASRRASLSDPPTPACSCVRVQNRERKDSRNAESLAIADAQPLVQAN